MNKMVTLFTVYVSFSWVYTQERHHWPEYNICSGCNVRHSFWHLFICNCLSKCVDGVLQDLMLNVVCWISSEFSQTLRPKPIIQWREIRAMVALINSRKWNIDCKQCNHLIHDVYFLKNMSLKCPNQTIKMTPSF